MSENFFDKFGLTSTEYPQDNFDLENYLWSAQKFNARMAVTTNCYRNWNHSKETYVYIIIDISWTS